MIRIWLILVSSPTRYSCFTSVTVTLKLWFFSFAIGRMIASTEDTRSFRVNSPMVSATLPLSILETSSTSLIRLKRCWPEAVIFFVYSRTFTGLSASFVSRVVKPRMAFMGVRISWDMLERKVVLELLAICAAFNASDSCRLCSSLSASRSFRIRICCLLLK